MYLDSSAPLSLNDQDGLAWSERMKYIKEENDKMKKKEGKHREKKQKKNDYRNYVKSHIAS